MEAKTVLSFPDSEEDNYDVEFSLRRFVDPKGPVPKGTRFPFESPDVNLLFEVKQGTEIVKMVMTPEETKELAHYLNSFFV